MTDAMDEATKPRATRILEGINQAGIPGMIGSAIRARRSGGEERAEARTATPARSVTATRNVFRDRMRRARSR